MREIKFKGKRIDNGEWVYGVVIFNKLGTFISTEENPHYCNQYGYIELSMPIQVVPESVVQFIGLKDAQNTDVYEGDFFKDSTYTYIVYWNEGAAGFKVKKINHSGKLIPPRYSNIEEVCKKISIYDNIHENPALI